MQFYAFCYSLEQQLGSNKSEEKFFMLLQANKAGEHNSKWPESKKASWGGCCSRQVVLNNSAADEKSRSVFMPVFEEDII